MPIIRIPTNISGVGASAWYNISGKPGASPTDIDLAVSNKHEHNNFNLLETYTQTELDLDNAVSNTHTHTNKLVIDLLTDSSGTLLYNGIAISGNMLKSIYDTNNDGIVDSASTLTGLTATVTQLNYLSGASANIQAQLNSLSNMTNFTGSVSTYADIATAYPTPANGDMVIVLADENHSNSTTVYIYNGSSWIYSGPFNSEIRNFSTDPLNLNSEVTGTLADARLSSNVVLESDFSNTLANIDNAATLKHSHINKILLDTYDQTNANLTSAVTNIHNHSNKALLDTYTQTNNDIVNSISKVHEHTNLTTLSKITENISGTPLWNGNSWPTTATEISGLTATIAELNYLAGAEANIQLQLDALAGGGATSETWLQEDVIAPAGTTSSSPYVVDLVIPYTSDFKRREPHVLKFIPGTQNVVRTACDFNLTDNTKFTVLEDGVEVPGYQSKYVVWDGTMHFKTSYTFAMQDEGPLEDGRLFSIQLTKSADGTPVDDQYVGIIDPTTGTEYKFKEITSMSVS